MSEVVEPPVETEVVEKAAMLSENIVKLLMMAKVKEQDSTSSLPQRGNLDQYLWSESTLTLPTVATSTASVSVGTMQTSETRLSPAAFLMQELSSASPQGCSPHSLKSLDHPEMFEHCTVEERKHYDNDAVEAIHKRDIAKLRAWHDEGRPLRTSNQFGETLLHIACRRGYLDVVSFLILEAKVSLWAYDEQGKTPLHLMCHSVDPLFELVDFVIRHDPDLLFVADVRGCMPLDYAPRDTWNDWISFFHEKECRDIMPRRKVFFTMPPTEQSNPQKALPFLDDIDNILAEFAKNRRIKKKKRSKSAGGRSELSSDDDASASSMNLKMQITEAILDKMNLSSLQDLSSLDPDTLLLTLQMQRRLDHKIGGDDRMTERRQKEMGHRQSSLSSINSVDRIEQLKQLEELKIRHVKATTSVEIALEVERQAQEALQVAQLYVRATRSECETVTHSILATQQRLGGDQVTTDSESVSRSVAPSDTEEPASRERRRPRPNVARRDSAQESVNSVDSSVVASSPQHLQPTVEAISPTRRDSAQESVNSIGSSVLTSSPQHLQQPAETISPGTDSDGTRRTQPPTDEDEESDSCICERLSTRFGGIEVDMKHIRCACEEEGVHGAGYCHLQLTFPIPFVPTSAPPEAKAKVTRRASLGGPKLSPMRGGGGALSRGRGLGSTKGLFRKTSRDE